MSPSYKEQVSDLKGCLALSNSTLTVIKEQKARSTGNCELIYKGIKSVVNGLKYFEHLKGTDILCTSPFSDDSEYLKIHNTDVMADRCLIGLESILDSLKLMDKQLLETKAELMRANEIVETHREGIAYSPPFTPTTPLTRISKIIESLDQENLDVKAFIKIQEDKTTTAVESPLTEGPSQPTDTMIDSQPVNAFQATIDSEKNDKTTQEETKELKQTSEGKKPGRGTIPSTSIPKKKSKY